MAEQNKSQKQPDKVMTPGEWAEAASRNPDDFEETESKASEVNQQKERPSDKDKSH
ncbi:hypothetical protein [Telmatospirillum sp. J64-1]|uniref:hypothetical protein n=1 Tax=Telmatospirillum sp. J64-1 TaxID=2502183 RepID=UPI00163DBAC0|nr:hypothetical protein [Telmatospirillum sp. J64-1]